MAIVVKIAIGDTPLPHLKVSFGQISRSLKCPGALVQSVLPGFATDPLCLIQLTFLLLWSHRVPAALSQLELPQEQSTRPRSREAQDQQILPMWLGARMSCEIEFSFEF